MHSRWRRPVLGLFLVITLLITAGFQVQAAPGAAPDQIPNRPLDGATGSPVHATGSPVDITGSPVDITGSPASSRAFAGGAGTADDPYQVATAAHLNSVRNHLNAHFVQTADIDLGVAPWNEGDGWTPIGAPASPFSGDYNGDGYVVHNLTATEYESFRGLFGAVTGVIENLGLLAVTIDGNTEVGGLVGQLAGGSIANCYVVCTSSGRVYGSYKVGGLVGKVVSGTIHDSYARCTISGDEHAGGLVGDNAGSILKSYSAGGVGGNPVYDHGGLVAVNTGTVTDSFWDVDVSGQTTSAGGAGKTTAQMQQAATFTDAGWDLDNTWVIFAEGAHYPQLRVFVKPIGLSTLADIQKIGADPGYPLHGYYQLTQDLDAAASVGLLATQDFDPIGGSFATPIPFTGVFDGQGYRITNLAIDKPEMDYVGLFRYLGDGAVVKNLGLENATVTGGDFSVGALAGRSENSTISNCYMTGMVSSDGEEVGGLVGIIDGGSITGSYASGAVSGGLMVGGLVGHAGGTVTGAYADVAVTGEMEAGGLAGTMSGEITDCYATGAVTATNGYGGGLVGSQWDGVVASSHATGAVNGASQVGGLLGKSEGEITDCYATGDISGFDGDVGGLVGWHASGVISSSYAAGAVTGGIAQTGGLVGTNFGTISACYATGSVTAGVGEGEIAGLVASNNVGAVIEDCYAVGAVTGGRFVGGLVASNAGTVSSSYWDTETSGQADSDGGSGRTTTQMTHPYGDDTYTGWDFAETWGADSAYDLNNGYPYLRRLVTFPAPAVALILPKSGENTEPLTVTVQGTGFQVGATLMLTRTGQAGIAASEVTVGSPLSLTGVLDLTDAAVGPWHVVVTNPDDQAGRLEDGFTVTIPGTTQVTVDPETESTLVYTDTQGAVTTLVAPAGSVSETVTLVYTPMITATPFSGWTFAGLAFDLEAYEGADPLAGYAFQQPVTLTISYTDAMVVGLDEESLTLTKWMAGAWTDVAETCTPPSTYVRDLAGNRLSVPICHLSSFALFGTEEAASDYYVYLPLVVR